MVELEYNGERYMVDGGKWYRRLKVGESKSDDYEFDATLPPVGWRKGYDIGSGVGMNQRDDYRVPCTDPRPPFVVGQRVKVARKDESWEWWDVSDENLIGESGSVLRIDRDRDCRIRFDCGYWASFPPWCLDAVSEPCLISPLEAAIAAEGVQLTQEESDRLDEITEKGLAHPTVEIPVRVSEQKEASQ